MPMSSIGQWFLEIVQTDTGVSNLLVIVQLATDGTDLGADEFSVGQWAEIAIAVDGGTGRLLYQSANPISLGHQGLRWLLYHF